MNLLVNSQFLIMGLKQSLNSINQIYLSDNIGLLDGIIRYFLWHIRRLLRLFPTDIKLSKSRLYVSEHNSVASLVNCMGMYDFNNMNLIKQLLTKYDSGNFFDVGANVGSYTLIASEVKTSNTVSFEPNPYAFEELRRVIRYNKRENVLLMNIALSDRDGKVRMTDIGPQQCSTNKIIKNRSEAENHIEVTCKKLDSVIKKINIKPNIIKIDVEGHEPQILSGFKEFIRDTDVLIIENGARAKIISAMQENGFVGPYFYHFSKASFLKYHQRRQEDPVYIRETFKNAIIRMGFSLGGR